MKKKVIILKDYVMKNGTLQEKDNDSLMVNISTVSENETNDSTAVCVEVEELMENELGSEDINFNTESLNTNSEKGKCKWNHENTLLFLNAYEKRLPQFRDPQIKKKNLWLSIAEEMSTYGYNIDPDVIDKKMRNMRGTYNKILDNNKVKMGTARVNWEYFSRFQQMFGMEKCVKPKTLVSSINTIGDNTNELEATDLLYLNVDQQHACCSSPSSESSTSVSTDKHRWKKLDVFRKRQLEIEQEKLNEIKKIRKQIEESNSIERKKLAMFEKYLSRIK